MLMFNEDLLNALELEKIKLDIEDLEREADLKVSKNFSNRQKPRNVYALKKHNRWKLARKFKNKEISFIGVSPEEDVIVSKMIFKKSKKNVKINQELKKQRVKALREESDFLEKENLLLYNS